MSDEQCEHCRFWSYVEGKDERPCRRFPPAPVPGADELDLYNPGGFVFPVVQANEWCGEFQRRDDQG